MLNGVKSRGILPSGLREKVLEGIRPTRLQLSILRRLYHIVKDALEACEDLKLLSPRYRVELVGSAAKGTLLRDKWEIDVFLLLDAPRGEIKRLGEEILRSCLGGRLPYYFKYSEHPYATVSLMGMQADIVPAPLAVDPREAMGVERTPFHTRYVRSRLEEEPWLVDDILLFKSFLKGVGVYGAETRVGGFSGYLAEVLVIHYRGFEEAVKAASSWRPPVMIDTTGGKADFGMLARRYPDSPMIVPDPVDPSRNTAASVTLKRLSELVHAANLFMRKPSQKFFHAFQPRNPCIKPLPGVMVVMVGDYSNHPPDAIWGRIKRIGERLFRAARARGYPALSYAFYTDEATEAAVYIHMESPSRYHIEARPGPPPWESERAVRFTEKRLGEGGWVWVGEDGSLSGARLYKGKAAVDIERALETLPLPPGTRMYRVIVCPSTGRCGFPSQLEALRDPTPPWVRYVLEDCRS
ncbi:tRNA CCA-pyrophosphorylase [Aeropyrum camini SY1 = JCM 12091]|uniref:CCA-adding enzyme n=1 Tax=Aeropyrum camini SY1 = JCM 12091 TaxID=1198449 RepID=U3TDS6_9CREN|nr:tRNA CCA-pyrophosphorylase [Aeropyrum camini SY1 = JCM 12091]